MTVRHFTPEDSAVLFIDHQTGTMSWVGSTPFEEMKANALALAKAAKALGMPLILTTSLEDQLQGPLLAEFAQVAPDEYAARVQRTGAVNAMDEADFAAAVRATGRRNLIIAGVTNDARTVYPTLTALDQGYGVQVVADAGGSTGKLADDVALRRMERAGAHLSSTNMTLTGLASHWAASAGQKLLPLVGELIPA